MVWLFSKNPPIMLCLVISIAIMMVSTTIIFHVGMQSASPNKHNVKRGAWSSIENPIQGSLHNDLDPGSGCKYNATFINCFDLKLTKVPTESFPDTAINYDLGNNSITRISDFAFSQYTNLTNLKWLCLSYNKIAHLSNFSFFGLTNLKTLLLHNNKLLMTPGRFPAEVFSPLSNVEILELHGNNPRDLLDRPEINYPDTALSRLTSLQNLSTDGLTSKDLGQGFQNLTNLISLKFKHRPEGYCKIVSLHNSTFKYVTNLSYLSLDNCGLDGAKIEFGAFSPLRKLVNLSVGFNENIGFENLDRIFLGLRETKTFKLLYMQSVVYSHSLGICVDSSYISHFPQHLEELHAEDNLIEGIDRDVIAKLAPSLRLLAIGLNNFGFGTYFIDFHKMENLTELRYYVTDFTRPLPRLYPHKNFQQWLAVQGRGVPPSNCSLYETREGDPPLNETFVLRLPPNLRRVNLNRIGMMKTLSQLDIDPNNTLEYLNMEHNYFPQLEGNITGLQCLKNWSLGSNAIEEISSSFFLYFPALEALDLSANYLESFFREKTETNVFANLTNLISLNLTSNDITGFPSNTFANLYSLKHLLLGNNPLNNFVGNVSHLTNLEYLDLRNTRISFLSVYIRKHINTLINQKYINFTLDLALTPIACICPHLDFLQWLTESNVVKDKGNYKCLYSDSSIKIVSDFYFSTLKTKNRECASHVVLFLGSGTITLLTLIAIIGAIVYRFRWKLRYLYYAAYLHFKQKSRNSKNEFEFDAFISYDSDDIRFVMDKLSPEMARRGLRLCIHSRDFTAGVPIASNIVKAVCNSRKTVVVLTRALMNSYWCGYEIQMANMESVQKNRHVLIFLILEEIPENELGIELLYNIRINTYIPFPDPLLDDISMRRLWDKLAADIED